MSRPLFVRELTQAERKELTRLIHSNGDARIVRRAQMIRLSAEGKTASQIAALWDVTGEAVRRAIHRFNAEGISALADQPRKGRPPKKTDRYVGLLSARRHHRSTPSTERSRTWSAAVLDRSASSPSRHTSHTASLPQYSSFS